MPSYARYTPLIIEFYIIFISMKKQFLFVKQTLFLLVKLTIISASLIVSLFIAISASWYYWFYIVAEFEFDRKNQSTEY